jgi:Predicted oxidoreductases (related to aryl-alcohol dehydrogenases)
MMSVQNPYNLLNRTYEVGLAEISIREQSGLLALLSFGVWIFNRKILEINNLPAKSKMQLFKNFYQK